MPKYRVYIAREEITLYWVDVTATTESKAEDIAWQSFNDGSSSVIDTGEVVFADEYICSEDE